MTETAVGPAPQPRPTATVPAKPRGLPTAALPDSAQGQAQDRVAGEPSSETMGRLLEG